MTKKKKHSQLGKKTLLVLLAGLLAVSLVPTLAFATADQTAYTNASMLASADTTEEMLGGAAGEDTAPSTEDTVDPNATLDESTEENEGTEGAQTDTPAEGESEGSTESDDLAADGLESDNLNPGTEEPTGLESTENSESTEEADTTSDIIAPLSQNDGEDSLTVNIGTSGVGGVDVDSLGNVADWPLNNGTYRRQLDVIATFSNPTSAKMRTIKINVPQGMVIAEFSALGTSHEVGPANYTARTLELTTDKQAMLTSVDLTAANGSTWAGAPYAATQSYFMTPAAVRDRSGTVLYTFNSAASSITLTLTLDVDTRLLPHSANTMRLPNPLTVEMTSGTVELNENLDIDISNITPTFFGASGGNISSNTSVIPGVLDGGNSEEGTAAFGTEFNTSTWHGSTNSTQNHYAPELVYTVSYPEGVNYEGFTHGSRVINSTPPIDERTNPAEGSFANGFINLVHDEANRTLTYTVSGAYLNDNTYLQPFWSVDIESGSAITWDDALVFSTTLEEASGVAGLTDTATWGPATHTVTVSKPGVNLSLAGYSWNRVDLNANGDYPYDYYLGGFDLDNLGPSAAENITYSFDFPSALAIRQVNFAPADGQEVLVSATTNERTIAEYAVVLANNPAGSWCCRPIGAAELGLGEDEYLTHLEVTVPTYPMGEPENPYEWSHLGYHGRFQNGQTGTVTLTVTADNFTGGDEGVLTATSTPTIDGTRADGQITTRSYTNEANRNAHSTNLAHIGGSAYPGDTIYFQSQLSAYEGIFNQDSIVDPDFYISLPAGIELDTNSVMAQSPSGNHGVDYFPLVLSGRYDNVIDGVTWTTYKFSAPNVNDMIACEPTTYFGRTIISLHYEATVSSSCERYTELTTADVCFADIGTEPDRVGGSVPYYSNDAYNWTGRGTTHRIVNSASAANNFAVVLKPYFLVSLGIRTTAESSMPFYTYNGTEATIAPVTIDHPAEVWLKYENASTDTYYEQTEIYLPIPKEGTAYDHYFNNIDPAALLTAEEGATHSAPEWTGLLTGPITLPGFTTYYTTDDSTNTNYGQEVTNSWVPYAATWATAPADGDYSAVTMVKFVANTNIAPFATGETTFTMQVDSEAGIGDMDFWRSYQKGWQNPSGLGTWVYGSVIAASPSMSGVRGLVFDDLDGDGVFDEADGERRTDLSGMSAVLTSPSGAMTALNITINADGSFRSVNSLGEVYYLKPGNYKLTITNENTDTTLASARYFTSTTSATHSAHTGDVYPAGTDAWYMDVPQGVPANQNAAGIADDHSSAVYTFTVGEDTSAELLIGVGLAKVGFTLSFDANATDATAGNITSKSVTYGTAVGMLPTNAPEAPTRPGFTFSGWSTDSGANNANNFTADTVWATASNGTVYAVWTPGTDTAYKVEHYLVNSADVSTLQETENLTGTTGASVTATPKTYTGYTYDASHEDAVPTGTIAADGSLVLKLFYTANAYVIHYEPNADDATGDMDDTEAVYGESVTLRENAFERVGWHFTGWNTLANGTGTGYSNNAVINPYNTADDTTLYAQWAANTDTTYKVEHYLVNSLGTPALQETENLTGTTGASVTATIKDFAGHTYAGDDYTGAARAGTIAANGSLVLKMFYTANTYAIHYLPNADGANGNMADTPAVYGESVTLRGNAFVRQGYLFASWNTAADGSGSAYSNNGVIDPYNTAGDTTLYAQWTPASDTPYRVEHYLVRTTGTTLVAAESLTGTTGTTASARIMSYAGYAHNPSYAGTALSGTIAPDGSLVLRVYYVANFYTVTFVDFDGTVLGTSTVEYGGAATAPANPTRGGYTFTGWDRPYNYITSNITVTAQYVPIPTVTVTFIDFDDTVLGVDVVFIGDDATAPADPTRGGYTFLGWDRGYTNVTEDITVQAQYAINPLYGSVNPVGDDNTTATPLVTIFGNEVPLFGGAGGAWSLFDLLCTLLAIVLALVNGIRFIRARQEESEEDKKMEHAFYNLETQRYEHTEKVKTRRLVMLLGAIVLAIVLIILFILTQDLTQPMVIFDRLSIIFGIGAVLAIIATFLVIYKKNIEDDYEESEIAKTMWA